MLELKSCQYNLESLNKFRKGVTEQMKFQLQYLIQHFPSIGIFKGEVKSEIILEKLSVSKQPLLITENAFKIWFAI